MKRALLICAASLALCACDPQAPSAPSADQQMAQAQAQQNAEAAREVQMPALTNWSEKRQVKDLYELRDKMVPTWAYMQGFDGRLICLGQAIGYGIPYSVQFSNPEVQVRSEHCEMYRDSNCSMSMPQAEPNGLFMPNNAEGTWVQMLNPETGKVQPVYVEPRVTISQFRLHGPAVAADCPATKVAEAK